MPEVRIFLHARERLLSAARAHRVRIYRLGLPGNVAVTLLRVRNPGCGRHADRHDRCRDRVRRVVCQVLEGSLAGPGPQTQSTIVGGL